MEAVINRKVRTNRWQAWLVFLIPAVAMGMAWFMYFTGVWIPDGRTNKGELMLPPALFGELNLQEKGIPIELERLEGRWAVIVFGRATCGSSACRESLYKTRQVHIALGKESDRLVRLYVSAEPPAVPPELKGEHPELIWLNSSEDAVLKTMNIREWPDSQFYIVDPLGNIMMKYRPEQPGGDLLNDLKKLMKASKIG